VKKQKSPTRAQQGEENSRGAAQEINTPIPKVCRNRKGIEKSRRGVNQVDGNTENPLSSTLMLMYLSDPKRRSLVTDAHWEQGE
jgi:hypothetical protein